MRRAVWTLVLAAALGTTTGAGLARAQGAAQADSQATAAPPGPASTETSAQPSGTAYEDRVLEGLPPEDDPAPRYDASGWRRVLRWDLSLGTSRFQRDARARWGTGFYGQLETPSHGSLSAEGQLNPDDSSGHFTLRQRAMPLEGNWFGNHELGVINAPTPSILRLPSRVYLPTPLLRGASGEWLRGDGSLGWQLSTGQPGWLGVFPDTRFTPRPGRRTRAAGQWRSAGEEDGGWAMAAQLESALGVHPETADANVGLVNTDSSLFALRHAGPELRWQGQWMSSREPGRSRQGLWLDAEWDEAPRQWGAGLYRLDPGLRWAGMSMSNDAEGGYVRTSWRERRWSLDGSLDVLRSIERQGDWGYYATLGARWRLSRDSSLGLGGAWRQLGKGAGTAYVDWRFANAQGPAGLRLSHSTGLGQPPSTELSYDQDWQRLPEGLSLSTSVGLVSETADAQQGVAADTALKTSLNLSAELSRRAALRLQFNSENGRGGHSLQSLALSAHWQLLPRWSLEASYLRSQGQPRDTTPLDPLVVSERLSPLSDRSFLLMLRYQFEAGSHHIPLGGRAGAGGGSVSGVVFYDANRNGLQEASEAGVPNATVYLDNRYAMRTDSQGRFEFPSVAPGPRSISLRSETLPLPWSPVDKGVVRVEVELRESRQVLLPVQRPD